MKGNKKGFTLIEILVVVIIIGVLSAIAIPGYLRSMEKTKAASAMQALADIAKAEHDFFTVRSRYTDDFSDLTITMKDESVQQDADGNSYSTKHFTIELDEDLEAAKATRSGGDAPYTLYRLFDDPRIYCQPADNKYCQMLDLPAGSFNTSIGNWQSCPGSVYPCSMECSRNTASGFTCTGTYNEDGTYSEKVCSSTGSGQQLCTNAAYNEDGKKTRQTICDINVTNKCVSKVERFYDEYGNLLYSRRCTSNNSDGSCKAYSKIGSDYTYDANGNKLTERSCKTVDSSGNCTAYNTYGNSDYTYDPNGNKLTQRSCKTVDSATGNCTAYNTSGNNDYTYDTNGNRLTERRCSSVDGSGNCTAYDTSGNYDYTYDAHGNTLSQRGCKTMDSNGNCTEYSWSNYQNYTYDANGNMLTQRTCLTVDSSGNCTAYDPYSSNYDYTYDANGNMLTKRQCEINSSGSCTEYDYYDLYDYTYDTNGNMLTQRRCITTDSNGNCTGYDYWDNVDYTYDASGHQIISRNCSYVDSNGNCTTYEYYNGMGYDENGNRISYQTCYSFDGTTCTEWDDYVSYQ